MVECLESWLLDYAPHEYSNGGTATLILPVEREAAAVLRQIFRNTFTFDDASA